jgi:hypothetical protein
MRAKLEAFATIAMTLSSLLVAGLFAFRFFSEPRVHQPSGVPAATRALDNWNELLKAGRRFGNPEAKVTILAFSDFEWSVLQAICRCRQGRESQIRGRCFIRICALSLA